MKIEISTFILFNLAWAVLAYVGYCKGRLHSIREFEKELDSIQDAVTKEG